MVGSLTRDVDPTRGASQNQARKDPAAEVIAQHLAIRGPGAVRALTQIGLLKDWGIDVTPDVARRVLQHYSRHENLAVIQTYRTVNPDVHEPLVYYMRNGTRVKIGTTTNLRQRLAVLQPEQLLAVEPGDLRRERERHDQFAHLRIEREWFRYEDPLITHIDNVREQTAQREDVYGGPAEGPVQYISAEQVAGMHGVRRQSVYALANRHNWRRQRAPYGSTRYHVDDVEATFKRPAA